MGNWLPVFAQSPPLREKGRDEASTSYQSSQRGQEDIYMFIALADKQNKDVPWILGRGFAQSSSASTFEDGRAPKYVEAKR
jgi:hypothetical protein